MAKKSEKLLPAYLVVGDDALKRQRVLDRLEARIAEHGDLAFDLDEFQGASASAVDIIGACDTVPFASELRLVIVYEAQKLKKADQDAIADYLSSPNPTTVLALICEKLDGKTKLYKAFAALDPKAIIDCAPVRKSELPSMLRSMATGHGFVLTESAARLLIEQVGEDTVRLDAELKKLALMTNASGEISERDIREHVARTAEAKPWELLDALCERDLQRCIRIYGHLEEAPTKYIAMAVARLRELACASSLNARGQGNMLAAELGLPPWRVKNHGRWARNFTEDELRRALIEARECERKLKSSQEGDPFLDWLIATATRPVSD